MRRRENMHWQGSAKCRLAAVEYGVWARYESRRDPWRGERDKKQGVICNNEMTPCAVSYTHLTLPTIYSV